MNQLSPPSEAATTAGKTASDRYASTIAIAAAVIAAIRLAREPQLAPPTPRVASVVDEAVTLARTIMDKVLHERTPSR